MTRARDTAEVALTKVDYALPTNPQNGSGVSAYTFLLADARRLTTATNALTKTFIIPPQSSVVWVNNSILNIVNYGAGTLTIAGGVGVTVTNATKTLAQFESAALIRTGSDAWTLVPFSGGFDSFDSQIFTASGTFVVPSSVTKLNVCCVGGGGGGANANTVHGGGGGGGTNTSTLIVTPGQSISVVVGGGGGATATGGSSSFNGSTVAGGGGGTNTATGGTGGSGGGEGGTGGAGGTDGANGGAGRLTSFGYFGGGGGGGHDNGAQSGRGGAGGGAWGRHDSNNAADWASAWPNTGGGGGGSNGYSNNGGSGGSGIVIVKWAS